MPRRPETDLNDFADERGELIPLGRLVLWAGLAALAAFAAVLASRSDTGSRRITTLLSNLPGPARSVAATRPAAPAVEGQQLAQTIAALTADRDRLAARLDALERSLEVTGSVPAASAPVPQASAREVPVSRTEFGLELGTGPNLETLRALWVTLKGQHGGALEGLRPLVSIRDAGAAAGPELRLVAGPFLNAAAAARLCGVIAANGRLCQPVPFEGQRLALR
ncbi:MAG: hypothetical protein IT538_08075 [Variibacter sp.]|nr:hypothetical protein [Variibacter sp.]